MAWYNTYLSDYPQYNEVYDILLGDPDEYAVTLNEVKAQLNILTTETYDDTYLTFLIPACQKIIEKYISQSLTERQVTCTLSNIKGYIELPYGPYQSLISICELDNIGFVASDCFCIEGNQFKILKTVVEKVKIEYIAGYETVPEDIKLALLMEIVYRYNNRGNVDGESGVCQGSKTILNSHRRLRWL